VSIHQILNATNHDDILRIDEVELNIVKIVGILSNPSEHATNFTFKVNDGSGNIECKLWMEKDANGMNKIANLKNGVLVRVVGNIREYEGKFHISVYDALHLTDWNALTYHTLDVIHTHLYNTKGPLASANGMAMNSSSNSMMHSTPSKITKSIFVCWFLTFLFLYYSNESWWYCSFCGRLRS
jgi:replication factor A2